MEKKEKNSAVILDGQKIAQEIKRELKEKISRRHKRPGLAVILIGDDPASTLYVNLKEKACQNVGIDFHKYLSNKQCCDQINAPELIKLIKFLNNDPATDGIIVQLPLPKKYPTQKIIDAINPKKDVDGFHPKNQTVSPPTILAILELLKATQEKLAEKNTLIIGHGTVFSRDLAKVLKEKNKIKRITIKRNIPIDVKNYDLIIIALGRAKALKKSMVKPGAIVIDVGINRLKNKVVGDADQKVREVAGFVSPVPGGVGPLTVACLLKNTFILSRH